MQESSRSYEEDVWLALKAVWSTQRAPIWARRELAANGWSIAAHAPISEVMFFDPIPLADSRNNIRLDVRPAGDRPQRLFEMFYRRDMPFAACTE